MALLDGKAVAKEIRQKIKKAISGLDKKPGLAVVLVGDNPESALYVEKKQKACEHVGIYSEKHQLDKKATEDDVLQLIETLNNDDKIHGILVQFPLPKHVNETTIMHAVSPHKDVDGFHPVNLGRIMINDEFLVPATPRGIVTLLAHYKIDVKGKQVVLVNRSKIVGKPLLQMLLNRDATVTVCHSKTKQLKEKTVQADILITGTGKRHFVTEDMVKDGAVVVDFGTKREGDKLYGDVDFDAVKDKVSFITPVPGGVGPMTIASLLENCLVCYKAIKQKQN